MADSHDPVSPSSSAPDVMPMGTALSDDEPRHSDEPHSDMEYEPLITPRTILTNILRQIEATPAAGYELIKKKNPAEGAPAAAHPSPPSKDDGRGRDEHESERWRKRRRVGNDGAYHEGSGHATAQPTAAAAAGSPPQQAAAPEPPRQPQRWALPTSHRRLLMTLHTLLPHLALPALDLLDRGLLTRLVPLPPRHGHETLQAREEAALAAAHQGIYIARSAKSVLPRRGRGVTAAPTTTATTTTAPTDAPNEDEDMDNNGYPSDSDSDAGPKAAPPPRYITRVGAWNCTCAEFAASTYLPDDQWLAVGGAPMDVSADFTGSGAVLPLAGEGGLDGGGGDVQGPFSEDDPDAYGRGTFGGLSLDGTERADARFFDMPCCKHLLAGLLVERWDAVLERRVRVRCVTREEMAGLVAGV